MSIESIKSRYDIIGNSPQLHHCIEVALQVAQTDLSVLILGESGVGKEVFSKIIHYTSKRKHQPFIAVNCGAIPHGTIDSELFGHEKGSFTSAIDTRKGYFETVNKGTIFLDEIGEMPLGTQARLLRVLEIGEYFKVGSSKVEKTDVRVIAATNRDLLENNQNFKFREDLYYRLSTVPIRIPPLRERKQDIPLLFKKFANDFSVKYHTDVLSLTPEAIEILKQYPWYGNIRELKNMAEKISILHKNKILDKEDILQYINPQNTRSLVLVNKDTPQDNSEKEILLKLFLELKKDVTELKKIFFDYLQDKTISPIADDFSSKSQNDLILAQENKNQEFIKQLEGSTNIPILKKPEEGNYPTQEAIEDSLNLGEKEKEIIKKALKKFNNKRRDAASELGISERTLYRKIKDYNL